MREARQQLEQLERIRSLADDIMELGQRPEHRHFYRFSGRRWGTYWWTCESCGQATFMMRRDYWSRTPWV